MSDLKLMYLVGDPRGRDHSTYRIIITDSETPVASVLHYYKEATGQIGAIHDINEYKSMNELPDEWYEFKNATKIFL